MGRRLEKKRRGRRREGEEENKGKTKRRRKEEKRKRREGQNKRRGKEEKGQKQTRSQRYLNGQYGQKIKIEGKEVDYLLLTSHLLKLFLLSPSNSKPFALR